MKRLILSMTAIAAFAIASHAAIAADMPARQPLPPQMPVKAVAPIFNWSGFYVGVHGGYGWGKSSLSDPAFAVARVGAPACRPRSRRAKQSRTPRLQSSKGSSVSYQPPSFIRYVFTFSLPRPVDCDCGCKVLSARRLFGAGRATNHGTFDSRAPPHGLIIGTNARLCPSFR
jgi:hypothetical protein